ncbi:hypothetical protein [Planktotalea sp.]|uniref:hypothetical protein n=1 Tax=Planktotalea sp. TaxID=2029877 RepID=UPI003F6D84EB
MIAATDIKDEKSLRQWLEEWPKSQGMDEKAARKVAVRIAHRAAMRVFSIAWEWFASEDARKRDLTALPILRSNLISGVASTCPTPEISRAADAAANAAADAAFAAAYAADTAANAADIWKQIVKDAILLEEGRDLSTDLLWAETPPDWFQAGEVVMLEAWRDAPDVWGFWTRWWLGATRGEPLNWDLQTKVALIEDEEWAQGPEHIAGVIGGIEAEFKSGSRSALSKASSFDYEFDPIHYWMKLVGFSGDLARIEEKGQVEAFKDDAATLLDDLQDFIDYAQDAKTNSNSASLTVRAAEKLLSELQKCCEQDTIRVRALIEKGAYLNSFALEADLEAEFGPTLAKMLFDRIDQIKALSQTHLAGALIELAPLKELELAEHDPAFVLEKLKASLSVIREQRDDALIKLSPEGEAAFDSMFEDLVELESAIQVAPTDERKTFLLKRFAEKVGAFGANAGHYIEKAKSGSGVVGSWLDGLIKNFKRWKSLQDILDFFDKLGGGPPPV